MFTNKNENSLTIDKDLLMSETTTATTTTTTTTTATDKDLSMSETTTTTTNDQKDLPMIDFEFFTLDAIETEPQAFEKACKVADRLESIYKSIQSEKAVQAKILKLKELNDALDDAKGEYYYPACQRISDIDLNLEALEELDGLITDALNACNFSSVESHLISASHELSDERGEYESEKETLNQLVEFFDEIEISLNELSDQLENELEDLENPQVCTSNNEGDDLSEDITKMTDEEHRLTWEGANAQDIANLVNKILTNKELATHLALEAIKAERFLSIPDYNSCPNGQFSK